MSSTKNGREKRKLIPEVEEIQEVEEGNQEIDASYIDLTIQRDES